MAKYIVNLETGESLEVTPSNMAVVQAEYQKNPSKYSLEEDATAGDSWAELVKRQPQEMNQAIKDATKAQVELDTANEGVLRSAGRVAGSMLFPQTLATLGRGGSEIEGQRSFVYGDIPAHIGTALSVMTANPAPAYVGQTVGPMLGTFAGKEAYSPIEAGLAVGAPGIGMGLGALAGAVGRTAKKIAPATAYYAVKPTLKAMGVPNPPDFNLMLKEKMFPYFGGLKGAYNRMEFKLAPMRKELKKAIESADESGVRINIEKVKESALDAINSDQRIVGTDKEKILNALNKEMDIYEEQATKYVTTRKYPELSAETTVKENTMDMAPSYAYAQKQGLQESAFQKSVDADRGTARAHAELARGFNRQFDEVTPELRQATRAVAPYESMISSLQRRLGIPAAQNQGLGLNDYQSAQAGGELVGNSAKGMLAGFLAKRLMSTTGGAQMMYDVGGKLVSLEDLLRMRVR